MDLSSRLSAVWREHARSFGALARRTWIKSEQDEVLTRAAAIAFYAMMAIVPFLGVLVILSVQLLPDLTGRSPAAVGVGRMTVGHFEAFLKVIFAPEAYDVVKDQITRLQSEPPIAWVSLGLVLTIWLASSPFVVVGDALNRIHGVVESRPLWKVRLIALGMTVLQAAILFVSVLAIVLSPQVGAWLGLSPLMAFVSAVSQWIVTAGVLLLNFSLVYRFGPDCPRPWRWVTRGSIAGTVAFVVETFLFRIYVQDFAHYDRTYGSLGGVMVLLFWFWMSSVILLWSAEINQVIEEANVREDSAASFHTGAAASILAR
jgi:membrane protein